jgi:hypothetical protein
MAAAKSSFLLILTAYMASVCACSTCSDTLISSVKSADGGLVATVFERNCGATTDFSSMVNLQNSSDKFNANEGRLFVAKGRYDVSVTWTGPKQLVITCNGCQRRDIFREVTAEGDIDISYKFMPR